MKTREVPKEQWEPYFDSLSNLVHASPRKVSVRVESPELGDQEVASGTQLRAIFYEEKGSEKTSFDIEVGDDVSGNRAVQRVEAETVYVEESPDGAPVAIDIEGTDRESRARIKTIIRFER